MNKVGSVLPERIFWIDRGLLKAYADASGDQNPIHQNEKFALSVGLLNVIAHGMLTMALVGKYVTDWAGDPDLWQQSALTGYYRAAPIFQLFLPEKNAA
jgi:acyl dehydratase